MPKGYWWQCDRDSQHMAEFRLLAPEGIVAFLQNLARSNWDQMRLIKQCNSCSIGVMVITYEFPRKNRVLLQVKCIVGITDDAPDYLPMMWETVAKGETEPWFDFKYLSGSNSYGLNRPVVFSRSSLERLFAAYSRLTGKKFP
jgi:hypothetical protein